MLVADGSTIDLTPGHVYGLYDLWVNFSTVSGSITLNPYSDGSIPAFSDTGDVGISGDANASGTFLTNGS